MTSTSTPIPIPSHRPRLRRTLWALLAVLALLVILPAAPAGAALDSKGTNFWLAFPGNYSQQELWLFITGDTATTGTVSIPGLGFVAPFAVVPGTVTQVAVPVNTQIATSDTIEAKGINVTALAEVTVYGLNRATATTDAYLGLPVDVLGTDYINLGYKNSNIVNGTQFALVAAENGTTVTITPTETTGARVAGVAYTILLNQGQTYQLRNTNAAPADLSGSIITSDKPIAVYGSHQCANIPPGSVYCDYIVEQLTPTTTWGKNFVSMPLATRPGGDTFRLLASTNGTTVSVNGAVVATLNRGQYHEMIVMGPAQITSSNPILVMQYSNSGSFDGVPTSDPFQMMIPPFEQFLAGYTVSTPTSGGFPNNYVNIVAPNAAVGSITVDGVPIPAASYTAIGASGFSGVQWPVSVGSHNINGPLPFGVHSYGFGPADSYGYPGGLSVSEVATVTNVALTPKTGTNPVNTQHCVTATVTDQNGQPVEGVRVDFSVSGANTRTGFAFTNASGQAQFCYTGTNTGGDTITATVGTLSDTATKNWVQSTDTTKPTCIIRIVTGPPKQVIVTLQDTGSGIASIEVTKSINSSTVVPPFTVGTTGQVTVTATKIDQSKSSQVELKITDVAGNVTICDPVLTLVTRIAGKPETETFTGLPQAESKITLTNGSPGVNRLDVVVNGVTFKLTGLKNGETRRLDVASAMKAGSNNTISLSAYGKPGGSIDVIIADVWME